MKTVYIGAAIDLAQDLNPFDAMSKILIESKSMHDCLIFRPDTAWNNARAMNESGIEYLMSVNNWALDNADLAVFSISSKVYSQGVAMEVARRLESGRPTAIIADKMGLYLKGLILNNPKCLVYDSLEDFKSSFDVDYQFLSDLNLDIGKADYEGV